MQKDTYTSSLKLSCAAIGLIMGLGLTACLGDDVGDSTPPPIPAAPAPEPEVFENGLILVANFGAGEVISVDPVTGERLIVSQNSSDGDPGVGGGPNFGAVSDIQISADGQSLIAVDLGTDTILDVNVNSGQRIALSSGIIEGTGDGSVFGSPHGIEIVNGTIFIADFGLPGIVALDANSDATAFSTTPVDGFIGIRAIDLLENGDIIAADFAGDRIFIVDPINGTRTLLSGPAADGVVRGEGPELAGPVEGILLDANTIVSAQFQTPPAMFFIDRTTGDRTLLTGTLLDGETRGSGPEIAARALVLNPDDPNIIYATSFNEQAVFEIDISTGDRTIISTAGGGASGLVVGSGTAIGAPLGIVVDTDGSLLIADLSTGGGAIVRVDPETGDRVLISSEDNAAQTQLDADGNPTAFGPFGVGLANVEIFAADGNGLFQVDADTGVRTAIGELNGEALFAVLERDATSVFVSNFGDTQGIEIVNLPDGSRTVLSNATNGGTAPSD